MTDQPIPYDELETQFRYVKEQLERANDQLAAIGHKLDRADKETHSHQDFGTLADRIEAKFNLYQRRFENITGQVKSFNQDVIVYLRAIELLAHNAGNGGTHYSKEERLKALVEQIESAIESLRKQDFDFNYSYIRYAPDVWRSDYPVRDYVLKIHKLEDEIKNLKGEKPDEAKEEPTDF